MKGINQGSSRSRGIPLSNVLCFEFAEKLISCLRIPVQYMLHADVWE
jgi:hypothetical protein